MQRTGLWKHSIQWQGTQRPSVLSQWKPCWHFFSVPWRKLKNKQQFAFPSPRPDCISYSRSQNGNKAGFQSNRDKFQLNVLWNSLSGYNVKLKCKGIPHKCWIKLECSYKKTILFEAQIWWNVISGSWLCLPSSIPLSKRDPFDLR